MVVIFHIIFFPTFVKKKIKPETTNYIFEKSIRFVEKRFDAFSFQDNMQISNGAIPRNKFFPHGNNLKEL